MDLRLLAPSPCSNEIYYDNANHCGAKLDADSGNGQYPENIYWASTPPTGTYYVCVNRFNSGTGNPAEVPFTLMVKVNGTLAQTYSGVKTAKSDSACTTVKADLTFTYP